MKSRSTRSKNEEDACPNSFELELEFLGGVQSIQQSSRLKLHSGRCKECGHFNETVSELYELLAEEAAKPVSNQLLDFIRAKTDLPGGIIICSRLPQADYGSAKAYKTKLIFSINGHNKTSKISQYNLTSIPKSQIMIRVLQCANNLAILFLCSPNNHRLDKQTMQFAGNPIKIHINPSGIARINCASIEELDSKTLFFEGNGSSSSWDGLQERIVQSILF